MSKDEQIKQKVIELLELRGVSNKETVVDNIISLLKHVPKNEHLTFILQAVEIAKKKDKQKMKPKIVFLDMDGPLANFPKGAGTEPGQWADDPPAMFEKGFYRNLEVMPGAREAVTKLLKMPHLEIHIASKPTTKNLNCATEKFEWVEEHFPELLRGRLHLIQDKGLLIGDYLIDDYRERWEPVFKGKFIWFDERTPELSWQKVLEEVSL